MTDLDLVQGLIRGDKGAANAFVDKYQYVLMSRLRRFRQLTREDAEDLFQQVFLRIAADDFRALRQWRGDNLSGYLKEIARNLACDFLRRQARNAAHDLIDEVDTLASPDRDPEAEALINQLRRMTREAIQRLAPPHDEVITLSYLECLAYPQIAARLNITTNNVAVRLTRARERLREVIESEFPALIPYMRDGN